MTQIHTMHVTDTQPCRIPPLPSSEVSSLIPLALHWAQPSCEEQVAVSTLPSLGIPWPSEASLTPLAWELALTSPQKDLSRAPMPSPSVLTAQRTAGAVCGVKASHKGSVILLFVYSASLCFAWGQCLAWDWLCRGLCGGPPPITRGPCPLSLENRSQHSRPVSWCARVSRRPLPRGRKAGAVGER